MQQSSPLSCIDGKYDVLRQLGEGGMGAVYEARNRGTGRRVAIKVILGQALARNKDIIARFQREAFATGAIESQYIAHVLDTGVDPPTGSPYMVMELLTGEDLEQAVRRLGPLHPELALRIAAQACLGLQKAHEANVVHRDIKPANIYLAVRDGGEVVAKVLDFGIAKVKMEELSGEAAALTRTGSMLGTPLYMSPEQALAKKTIDHRTDVWSLGAVLYEALAGTTPHGHAQTLGELIMAVCSQPARHIQEVAPWVRPEIAAIVHTALAMDPNGRFPTAEAMFQAIAALLPNGFALHTSLFVPMPPEVRMSSAPPLPRVSVAPPASLAPPPLAPAVSAAPIRMGTTGGVAQTSSGSVAPPRARAGAGVIVAGGVAVIAIVGAGVGFAASRSAGAGASPAASVSSHVEIGIHATTSAAVPSASAVYEETPELPPPPAPASATASAAPVASAAGSSGRDQDKTRGGKAAKKAANATGEIIRGLLGH